jgi:hypothetical protein
LSTWFEMGGYFDEDTVRHLADDHEVRLEPSEFKEWLGIEDEGIKEFDGEKYWPARPDEYPVSADAKINSCRYFKIPNTILAYWAGEVGDFGKGWVGWDAGVKASRDRKFMVEEKRRWKADRFESYLKEKTKSKELFGIYFWGHGFNKVLYPDLFNPRKTIEVTSYGLLLWSDKKGDATYYTKYADWELSYKMGIGIMAACFTSESRQFFSDNAIFWGHKGVLVPVIPGEPSVPNLLKQLEK